MTRWEPFAEPLRSTVIRTFAIALVIGGGVGLYQRRLAVVPLTTLIALWFTLGGHIVEILFLDHLRNRVGREAAARAVARLLVWFVGGTLLYAGALATRAVFTSQSGPSWPWWAGGVFFVGLELVIHLLLRARGLPSFYDGRG